MRKFSLVIVLAWTASATAFAQTTTTPQTKDTKHVPVTKHAPVKKATVTHSTAKATPKPKPAAVPKSMAAATKPTAKSMKKTPVKRTTPKSHKTTTQSRHRGQAAPTPERYKEIQQALAERGYMEKSTASGEWGAQSSDALKKFQQDRNLQPTGKLDSLSLIALGLGPKHEGTAPVGKPSTSLSQPAGQAPTGQALVVNSGKGLPNE
jgi:hypothetical protein